MIKLFYLLVISLFSENKVRLEKENQSNLDTFCRRITPYLLFIMVFILVLLALYVLIAHGSSITGTEANMYYYHMEG